MKIKSLILLSFVIDVILTGINYMYATINNRLLIVFYTMYGGEITIDYGLGVRFISIYAMTEDQHNSYSARFDFFSFIFSFLVIFLVLLIVKYLIKTLV